MTLSFDKLLHFVTGLAMGVGFWWWLERYAKQAARSINPLIFLIMLIWGASGLFFFRKLGIPLLSGTFFYMAVPDWDIPLYDATGLRFLIHRSWLFHSVLLPMGLLGGWFWCSQQRYVSPWQRTGVNLLRDGAIGLSVGMSAHLVWDALLSSLKRGFYIRGFGGSASYLWLFVNLAIGIGVPLLIAWSMRPTRSSQRSMD
ncbi:hypothetical protein [Nodosilinea sp. P-1105]|uniref:hypothetical protein n=1 Tax=Nodosilinea sp. P-1105 TaxID=2546229 RepID=UPI00146BB229|nr:hypothetical protein [Nodosilinea sp. P-1105]NMF84369.1 hypothetical protein [Nodosilinea sp. P-1105]